MSSRFIGEPHMKISNSVDSSAGVEISGASGRRTPKTAPSPARGDRVQLSGLLAHLSESLSSQHSARLSELTAAVSAGRYFPDAGAASAGIIQDSMATA